MKKLYFFFVTFFLFVSAGFGQAVTVTNPANTTPNLAASYTSLANAITALSGITGISGPVTITLNAGNPETAPAGGYVIQFTAATSAINNITIEGSGNTITAFTPQPAGNYNNGIFKLIGADYITLQNFTMQENAANTTTDNATNNMTEWGVALLHSSVTNGAQHNSILNNTISLNRTYQNTFGIYSNTRHSATSVVIAESISSFAGSNSYNRVYNNHISNIGYGIVFIGSVTAAFMDDGNDIGGSSATTGNTISNWGRINTAIVSYIDVTTSSFCVQANHQINENISYNTITSAVVSGGSFALGGILKNYSVLPSSGVCTASITNNTITLSNSNTSGSMNGILSQGSINTSLTINLNNNSIINCSVNLGISSSSFTAITNSMACGVLNINNNITRGFTNPSATGGFTGFSNTGAVTTTININNNQVGNAAGGAATFNSTISTSITAIANTAGAATATVNLNNNSIDGFAIVSSFQIFFIQNTAGGVAAVNMNNNQLGTATGSLISFSGVQSSALSGLYNPNGNAAMAISIQNNDIRGIVNTLTGTGTQQYINSQAPVLSSNISNNSFTNLVINSSSSVYLILKGGAMASGASSIVSNNSIVGSFSKTASGSSVRGYYSTGASVSGSAVTITNNNFSNLTVTGSTFFVGIEDSDGASGLNGPAKTISANTISNINMGTGGFYGLQLSLGDNINISLNNITNVTGSGRTYGIYLGTVLGLLEIAYNTISSLSSSGQELWGIVQVGGASIKPPVNNVIHHNSITGLSGGLGNSSIFGIFIQDFEILNIYDNDINNFTATGMSQICGMQFSHYYRIGTTLNVYRNNIHNLEGSNTNSRIKGMYLAISVTTVNVYNNFISELKAPNANSSDAIIGVYVFTSLITTNNLYNNSIYLNASSSGTNFGSAGIYHYANADPTVNVLKMVNNIVVNTSTANGTGATVAFWREGAALNNYAATSNYNLFYAGTPGVKNLIYYDYTNSDQTLAAYQARVSPRDANSISMMPVFTSATNLHLTPNNCALDNKGTPIAGITNDIDLDTRSTTVPDIGADEFDAYNVGVLAGVVSTAVCSNKAVVNTGTIYTDASCNLIANVLPSGGDPVAGVINTCVTMDASQLFFNGDPYVQRHYDIEPVISNQTTTSATITMYFTDAEFALYNTNNSATWPLLPTIASGGNASPFLGNVRVTQFHGTPTGGLPTSTPGNYTGVRVSLLPVSVVLTGSIWAVTVNVAGFSGFYVHTNLWFVPLPIVVNYLTGRKQGSNHLLNWKVTCVSSPRATMMLERSADSRNFTGINTITADAARCNQPFDYTDAQPLKGMNYYRLKIVDADGKVTYSTTVALINAVKGFDMISIAPNPVVRDNFKLNVASAQAGKMEISIFDMQGRLVNRQTLTLMAGYNSMPVNVANLAPGTYTIKSSMAGDQSKIIRFVKQ